MKTIRWIYKVFRSLILSVLLIGVGLLVLVYVALAIPPVQNLIKEKAVAELSSFLDSKVEIEYLTIYPLNEILIEDATFFDQDGAECLTVGRLGCGFNLWRLLLKGEIEITYVELIDFCAKISKQTPDSPLNIDFIVRAFAPKDKNKPPTKFDLKIHNVVIRGGELDYDNLWEPHGDAERFDKNHIHVYDLSADVLLPRLSNDDTKIDMRRLSLNERSGLSVRELSGIFAVAPDGIKVEEFTLRLPETMINTDDFFIPANLLNRGSDGLVSVKIVNSKITPSNFSAFYPPLEHLNFSLPFEAEIEGNGKYLDIQNCKLTFPGNGNYGVELSAQVLNYTDAANMEIDVRQLRIGSSSLFMIDVMSLFPDGAKWNEIIQKLQSLEILSQATYKGSSQTASLNMTVKSDVGEININGAAILKDNYIDGRVDVAVPRLKLAGIVPGDVLQDIEQAEITVNGSLNKLKPLQSVADVNLSIAGILLKNRNIRNIEAQIKKDALSGSLNLVITDDNLNGEVQAALDYSHDLPQWDVVAWLNDFDTYNSLLTEEGRGGFEMRGGVEMHAEGNNIDNISGVLNLKDFRAVNSSGEIIDIDNLQLDVSQNEDYNYIGLSSEIVDLKLEGKYSVSYFPDFVKKIAKEVSPSLFKFPQADHTSCGSGKFEINIKDASELIEFFNIPVFPLTALTIDGMFDSDEDRINVSTYIPYIQQGSNKLIRDTYLDFDLQGTERGIQLTAGTIYPTKKGDLKADLHLTGYNDNYNLLLNLNEGLDVKFYGKVALNARLSNDLVDDKLEIFVDWIPTELFLNNAEWKVGEAHMAYTGSGVQIEDFNIRHDNQFVAINGVNTIDGEGTINIDLANIDVDYIFDTLNINHVTFGGLATGNVTAREIFSPEPDIHTNDFFIEKLSYNGGLLGDGEIFGALDLPDKKVAIKAKVREQEKLVADVDGGVWFGRDSLAFNFMADKVRIEFMQPFMKAFSSSVKGRATGNACLYGTFSDIDMTGIIAAEDAYIKIDYINAVYHGSDTVYLTPGRIDIPGFEIADKNGKTAYVTGEITHRYFHEPAFKFNVTRMRDFLVYDTTSANNPLWYGTIYARGEADISGYPGRVSIAADVQTESKSTFTFVLSDQQEAASTTFLTFSDRRRAERESAMAAEIEEPIFLQRFKKTSGDVQPESDEFVMDLRVSVTPDIQMNLIMDPVAGDKITAFGQGAMSMNYSSLTDELRIYGKYTLTKGSYNFSLQDIILKDFTIRPGSSIAFTGDPYSGILDITAAYRVNTSLTELDQSFASDKELNRTSVPVEALLKVNGVLSSPTISFDIDLPTVTEETTRKVKSIISTEDMMSRQVLYLVALNKFYSPEYMSTTNSGGEWASIASSTLSSQLQNMIGQITDKFTLAPSIHSDKGDFSDVEVDIAVSSNLFNNRLLINGNVGYRDPSNSSTTFIGDFDLEYLLNRSGTWRLKAYNHFNDQNYYLKSALTTQGIGILWRKDFGSQYRKRSQMNQMDSKKEEEIKTEAE